MNLDETNTPVSIEDVDPFIGVDGPGATLCGPYHPLGVVGIISAFNFPVAVWSWNTALAWVCGFLKRLGE